MSSFMDLLVDWSMSLHLPNLLLSTTEGVRATLVPIFARELGSSDLQIGLIIGSAGIVKVLLDVAFGFATSSFGCRFVMVAGVFLNIMGSLVATLAQRPAHLVIATLLWGSGIGSIGVALHVFIAKSVPRHIRGQLMAMISGGMRWCSVIGPYACGHLILAAGLRLTAFLLVPISFGGACCFASSRKIREVDEELQSERSENGGIKEDIQKMITAFKRYWDIVIRIGVYAFCITLLRHSRRLLLVLAAMNMKISPSFVGKIVAISYSVDALLFFLGGYIMDRFGRKYAAIPTTVNLGIAFFFLEVSTTPLTLVLSALFFGLADSTGAGIALTLTADHSPPSGGAPFMGLMRTVQDAGQMIGPILCGILTHHLSFSWACYVIGTIGILNGFWAFFMIPDKSSSELEENEEKNEEDVVNLVTVAVGTMEEETSETDDSRRCSADTILSDKKTMKE